MTYNRTTELRKKLTERGVEFATDDSAASKVTMWTTQNGGWMFDCDYMEPLNEKPGTIGAKTELMIYGYTPEQAIAATLGSGTCKLEPLSALDVTLNMLDQTEWGACSECGCAVPMDARFCNECGKAVSE